MKKNKTIAYMLAATLLVGGTFAGTKAWFSDQVTTDNGITITMGTLDLELKENGANEEGKNEGWKLIRDEQVIDSYFNLGTKQESDKISKDGDVNKEHMNIRPGDDFVREFTVKNTGSLDQIVRVDSKLFEGVKDFGFVLKIEDGKDVLVESNEFRLDAGKEKTIKLRLESLEEDLTNVEQDKVFNFEESFGDITLTGRQLNANKTQLSPGVVNN